jgi:uncharacterized protein Yka (UPF0111/DUF47 family)
VKQIMERLYTSFITPFEREDISNLAIALDDIVDDMNGVVIRLDLFNIQEMRDEGPQMAELTLRCVREVREMIQLLPNYKKDRRVMEHASVISKIEDEGDTVYENALRRLFREPDDGHKAVSWLREFDRMEGTLDACDRVAYIVRGVVMKSAKSNGWRASSAGWRASVPSMPTPALQRTFRAGNPSSSSRLRMARAWW